MKLNKLTALLSAGILAVCAIPMGAGAEILKGDVNQDGVVDNQDANLLLNYFLNYTSDAKDYTDEEHEMYKTYGDINGDGYVDMDDVKLLSEINSDITVNTEIGDVNHDGFVDAIDASLICEYYAALSTGNDNTYTEAQQKNYEQYGDVSNDGSVDPIDASLVLINYANNA